MAFAGARQDRTYPANARRPIPPAPARPADQALSTTAKSSHHLSHCEGIIEHASLPEEVGGCRRIVVRRRGGSFSPVSVLTNPPTWRPCDSSIQRANAGSLRSLSPLWRSLACSSSPKAWSALILGATWPRGCFSAQPSSASRPSRFPASRSAVPGAKPGCSGRQSALRPLRRGSPGFSLFPSARVAPTGQIVRSAPSNKRLHLTAAVVGVRRFPSAAGWRLLFAQPAAVVA